MLPRRTSRGCLVATTKAHGQCCIFERGATCAGALPTGRVMGHLEVSQLRGAELLAVVELVAPGLGQLGRHVVRVEALQGPKTEAQLRQRNLHATTIRVSGLVVNQASARAACI